MIDMALLDLLEWANDFYKHVHIIQLTTKEERKLLDELNGAYPFMHPKKDKKFYFYGVRVITTEPLFIDRKKVNRSGIAISVLNTHLEVYHIDTVFKTLGELRERMKLYKDIF